MVERQHLRIQSCTLHGIAKLVETIFSHFFVIILETNGMVIT